MKQIFRMQELDCANCAAKMERKIAKIEGVQSVTVNFLAQKLILEAEDAKWNEILPQVDEAVRKVDPDCRVILK